MAEYGGISLNEARECHSSDEEQEGEEHISPRSGGGVHPVKIGGGGGSSTTSSGVTKTKINKSGGGGGGGGGDFNIVGSGGDHHHQMMMLMSSPTSSGHRKPRGRPPGSKNKPKPPIIITRESESAMQPLILEISAGSDLIEMVSDFARRRHIGLSILSGSGSVANVTLRHPTSHTTTLSISGRFEILSLSGSFLTPLINSSSSTSKSSSHHHHHQPPFAITLAGGQGQVIGGTVAGPLIAATPVVLMAASFTNPDFHRLPNCEDLEDHQAHNLEHQEVKPSKLGGGGNDQSCSPASMSVSAYNVGGAPSPLSCQIPSEVLPWPPTSSRPPY